MPARYVLFGILVTAGTLISVGSTAAPAMLKGEAPKKESASSPSPAAATDKNQVLGEWGALGSGCKAVPGKSADVRMERLPQDPKAPNSHRARFHLPDYKLRTDSSTHLKFARECAIRLSVNPPKGKRVKLASAQSSVRVSKSVNVQLLVNSELKLGSTTVGAALFRYDKGTGVSNKEESVVLIPGTGAAGTEPFPESKCGEPRLLGIDNTFLAERKAVTDPVQVELAGEKVIEVTVDFEDCKG